MTRKFWNLKMERFSTMTPSYLSAFFKFAKFELKKIFQISSSSRMFKITPRRRKLRIEIKVYHKLKICFELLFYGRMEKISEIKVWNNLKIWGESPRFLYSAGKNVNGSSFSFETLKVAFNYVFILCYNEHLQLWGFPP